jgi:hypothetical protein
MERELPTVATMVGPGDQVAEHEPVAQKPHIGDGVPSRRGIVIGWATSCTVPEALIVDRRWATTCPVPETSAVDWVIGADGVCFAGAVLEVHEAANKSRCAAVSADSLRRTKVSPFIVFSQFSRP